MTKLQIKLPDSLLASLAQATARERTRVTINGAILSGIGAYIQAANEFNDAEDKEDENGGFGSDYPIIKGGLN